MGKADETLLRYEPPLGFRVFMAGLMLWAVGTALFVALFEEGNEAPERVVFGLAGVLLIAIWLRTGNERVVFYEDCLVVGAFHKTWRFERSDIVGFGDGGWGATGNHKLVVQLADGRVELVSMPSVIAKSARFFPLLEKCEQWLEEPLSVASRKIAN